MSICKLCRKYNVGIKYHIKSIHQFEALQKSFQILDVFLELINYSLVITHCISYLFLHIKSPESLMVKLTE